VIDMNNEEVQLAIRALSIHRVQTRRKLTHLTPGESAFNLSLREVRNTQALIAKLQDYDLDGVARAS
jgi:hypothetical protein